MKVGELFVSLGVDFSQYNKDLKKAEGMARKSGTTIGDIFKNAFSFTLGMGMFQAVQRGFQAVVGEAVNFNAIMEQAQIGFTTMLGSAEKAQAFLDEMAQFAAKTPFEYPELLEAARRMMAMGFAAEEVLPTLKAVGDAAAGLGVGKEGIDRITLALGQMRAKGRVSAEEMMQLAEAGVPAWEILADAIGKSVAEVRELSEKGLIPANKAVQILIEGMEKRFPNMMENMEDTWQGVASTIRDIWRMTMSALTAGLFKNLTSWLQRVRDWATEFYNTFRQFGLSAALTKAFGAEFAAAINMMTAILRGFWNTMKAIVTAIARHWAIIKPMVLGAVTAFLTFKIVNWILYLTANAVKGLAFATAVLKGQAVATSGVMKILGDIVVYYKVLMLEASAATMTGVGALTALRSAILAVWTALGPLGVAILAISAALTGGILLWNKYAASVERANLARALQAAKQENVQYTDSTKKAAAATEEQADALNKAGKAAGKNLQSFDEVHQIMEQTAETTVGTPDIAAAPLAPALMLEAPEDLFAALEQPAMTTGEKIKGFFAWLWDGIKQGAVSAWTGITGFLSSAWQGIVNLARPIWEPLAPFFTALWEGIKTVASTVWNVIGPVLSEIWTGIVTVAQTVWGVLGSFFSALWGTIRTVATTVWGIIGQMLLEIWSGIVTVAQAVWSVLGPFFVGLWEGIKTAAVTVWGLLQGFLTTIWSGIVAVAKTVWSVLGPFFTTLWEGIKATATVVWSLIQYFLATVWFSIVEIAKTTWSVLGLFFSWLWEGIRTVALGTWYFLSTALPLIWNGIVSVAKAVWSVLEPFFSGLWEGIKVVALSVWDVLSAVLPPLWNGIVGTAKAIWSVLEPFFSVLWASIRWVFESVWIPLATWLRDVWDSIRSAAQTVWNIIKQVIEDPIAAAKATVETVAEGIRSAVSTAWNKTLGAVRAVKNTLYEYIVEPFVTAKRFIAKIMNEAKNWGKNLISNIVNGIKAKANAVKNAVANVANKIKGFLGFSSPTEEGPGRYADRWAPNLMRMYAQGILANVNLVENAAGVVARSLVSMASVPAPAFSAVGGGGGSSRNLASVGMPATEIHLHIGTLIADDYGLKKLEQRLREIRIFEEQRLGQER